MTVKEIFKLIDDSDYVTLKQLFVENRKRFYSIHNGCTVYGYAVSKSLESLVNIHEIFLSIQFPEHYLQPYNLGRNKPIHVAVENGFTDRLSYLVDIIGVDVNSRNRDGNTALHLAIMYNRMHIFKNLLFSGGADVNIKNDRYETPVQMTIMLNRTDMFKKLLFKNAKLDIKDWLCCRNTVFYHILDNWLLYEQHNNNLKEEKILKKYNLDCCVKSLQNIFSSQDVLCKDDLFFTTLKRRLFTKYLLD